MLAECHWPDVEPTTLQNHLGTASGFKDLIYAIVVSEPVRIEGDRVLVHQVQTTKGIANREVLIWTRTDAIEGGKRFGWVTASDAVLKLGDGHVRAPRNDGYWEVSAHPDGGSRVAHRIAYDPGGSVPSWIVRWVSVGGMMQVMGEVRAKAATAR
jgi:hypothetical protein